MLETQTEDGIWLTTACQYPHQLQIRSGSVVTPETQTEDDIQLTTACQYPLQLQIRSGSVVTPVPEMKMVFD